LLAERIWPLEIKETDDGLLLLLPPVRKIPVPEVRLGWNCEAGCRLRKREFERIRRRWKEVWYDKIAWPVPRQEVSML
jgi:hypothetical protein